MRTKQLISGLNNSQKIRFVLQDCGFEMECQVSDVQKISNREWRVAVWESLVSLANYRNRSAVNAIACGHAGQWNGKNLQVDLIYY